MKKTILLIIRRAELHGLCPWVNCNSPEGRRAKLVKWKQVLRALPVGFPHLALLLVTAALAPAATRLVPSDYATIQAAINDCNDGDIVNVDPGTYYEQINFNGRNIVVRSIDPNDPETVAATIITGRTLGGDRTEGSVVTFTNGDMPQRFVHWLVT